MAFIDLPRDCSEIFMLNAEEIFGVCGGSLQCSSPDLSPFYASFNIPRAPNEAVTPCIINGGDNPQGRLHAIFEMLNMREVQHTLRQTYGDTRAGFFMDAMDRWAEQVNLPPITRKLAVLCKEAGKEIVAQQLAAPVVSFAAFASLRQSRRQLRPR